MKIKILTVVAVLMVAGALSATPITVDNFSTGFQSLTTTGTASSSNVSCGTCLGGNRDLSATHISGSGLAASSVLNPDAFLTFSHSSTGLGSGTATWNGMSSPVDLTSGGSNSMFFIDVQSDAAGVASSFFITVVNSGGTLTSPVTAVSSLSSGAFVTYQIPMASFTGTGSLSTATSVVLSWSANSTNGGGDQVDFDNLAFATPEPTTFGLMGAGLVALGLIARRRRNR